MIIEIIFYVIIERSYICYIFLDDDDDEYDDIDESISNCDQNDATNNDYEIDDFHETNGTESHDKTDNTGIDFTKMDDCYINEMILNDPKKNCTPFDICEIIGVKWDDYKLNVTEIDDCKWTGTISNDNETDEIRTHTASALNCSQKRAQKMSTLFDMSGIVKT